MGECRSELETLPKNEKVKGNEVWEEADGFTYMSPRRHSSCAPYPYSLLAPAVFVSVL